jgi:hypothetical protein
MEKGTGMQRFLILLVIQHYRSTHHLLHFGTVEHLKEK